MTGGSIPDSGLATRLPGAWRLSNGFSAWLFLRLLGVVHLVAHASLLVQVKGLLGARGVWPAASTMELVRSRGLSVAEFPCLLRLSATDSALVALCVAGMVAGLLAATGLLAWPALLVAGAVQLSFVLAGGPFLSFQWDALLVEATFLALLLQPITAWRPRGWTHLRPHRAGLILLLLLGFKLMLSSGAVKLASGDPTWADGTALLHHYQTQPLPTWTAWHMHHLPAWFHRASWGLMFAVELVLPFFLLLPRIFRSVAGIGFSLLMLVLMATGNYTYFNLLTLALSVLWIDDAVWRWLARRVRLRLADTPVPPPRPRWRLGVVAATVLVLGPPHLLQAAGAAGWLSPSDWPRPWRAVADTLRSRACFNGYGLFAVMTTRRPEIVIEVTSDGRNWEAVEFRHKPGDLARRPGFVAPHQPRLDWQMWFAALAEGDPQPWRRHPWLVNLLRRLLENEPSVRELFAHVPAGPPVAVRCALYGYRFSTPEERAVTGDWWVRWPRGMFIPAVTRDSF